MNLKKKLCKPLVYIILFIILFIIIFIYLLKYYPIIESYENNLKYKLSVIGIFKNETMNLKIWIEHYLWQGVEHFYLIDNDSDDNPDFILNPYIEKGLVTLYKLPEKYKQLEHYKTIWMRENIPSQTKWLIMADLDEFWFSPNNKLINIIDDYDFYDVIYSNWKMFGSDGNDKHPYDIRTNIVFRQPELSSNTKWICKPKNINLNNIFIHNIIHNKVKEIYINDKIQLNHYPIQSREFFEKVKLTRTDVASQKSDNIRDWDYFKKYNENMIYEDTILKDMIMNI